MGILYTVVALHWQSATANGLSMESRQTTNDMAHLKRFLQPLRQLQQCDDEFIAAFAGMNATGNGSPIVFGTLVPRPRI
jgi:hypothetical protein